MTDTEPRDPFNPHYTERPTWKEGKLPSESFWEVQDKISNIIDNTSMSREDRDRELTDLWAKRRALTAEAKRRGVLRDVSFSVTNAQEVIKAGGDYVDLMQKVSSIDDFQLESSAKGMSDWDDRFEGMIGEYKNVSVVVMEEALLEALQAEAIRKGDAAAARNFQTEIDQREREIKKRAWGSVPRDAYGLAQSYVSRKGSSTDSIEDAFYNATKKFYAEREPSLELALKEFQRAERLCEMYKAEDHRLISDKIKDETERRIFEIEFKFFNTALVKRFQGGGTMKGVGENGILKTISAPEIVYLFKMMPGYFEAMQEIADVVVHRKDVGGLNYTLVDCQNEDQFKSVASELDKIITNKLTAEGFNKGESEQFANRAVSTAINTMYAFNVFEFYNSYWDGRIRYKSEESEGTAVVGKEAPTKYDRLVSKPIQDALCPMDDLINEILKERKKKPVKNNLNSWAEKQMEASGVTKLEHFDSIEVLETSKEDAPRYWTVEMKKIRTKGIETQERVLLVPPLRPKRLFGSILNDYGVNLTSVDEDGNFERKPFIDALAEKNDINWDEIGLAANFCSLYTLDAPDLDILKDVFRGRKPLNEWPDIMRALGTFEQGNNKELDAWIYVDLAQAIDPNKRGTKLISEALYWTRFAREKMGLPRQDNFDILDFCQKLPDTQKINWE